MGKYKSLIPCVTRVCNNDYTTSEWAPSVFSQIPHQYCFSMCLKVAGQLAIRISVSAWTDE